MTVDRDTLARYFRQLADLGITDIYLDDLTARDALAVARGQRLAAPVAPSAPAVRTVPASTVSAADDRLRALAETSVGCSRCALHTTRTNIVFGEGNPAADVVVVGEAPGQEEDRTGRPFVGRAGKLLDLLLLSCGFPRHDVYICNVLKCRPPNNRDPQPDEVTPCTTNFLHGQIDTISPRVVLAVGKFAAQSLLETQQSVSNLRGRVHTYRGKPLVVTFHPAFLLRSPHMMRAAWQDLQMLRGVVDEQR